MSSTEPTIGADENPNTLPALHTVWDYFDPAGTRERFETIRPTAEKSGDREYYLSLLTQIARTHGLQGDMAAAHALLDTVEAELTDTQPLARVNYLLERGRSYRSGGEVPKSIPLFQQAFDLAKASGQDYLAIDAAHMIALAVESPDERMEWNRRGLALADASSDPRTLNWRGSINNNIGWELHDRGEYDSALAAFQTALDVRVQQGDAERLRIAKWCVGRCLRSLQRTDEALDIQRKLDDELRDLDKRDGFVFEELAELYLVKGDSAQATRYFQEAYTDLSQDEWFVENEAARLARIKDLGKIE